MTLREQLQATLGTAYSVERELGGGGMSHVFLATDPALGRTVVIKVLPFETASISADRFKREVRLAASLQHPHIVSLISAGESNGLPFYVMPYVKGESLREHLLRSGELSVPETIRILRDVASALAYAHREGVVHRDIKPENIIESGGVAVVTDFGVSKAVGDASRVDEASLTSVGVALGTPAYMSPEQSVADPHVDQRSDIYAFGCVAYEMLTGASPFAGRPLPQVLAAHIQETPVSVASRRSATPPALAALVTRCLAKRPGDRPQSADELIAALDALSTPVTGSVPAAPRSPSRAGVVATVAVIAIIVVGGIWWTSHRGAPSFYSIGSVTRPIAVSSVPAWNPAISPDGKLVAFTAGAADAARIYVRQVDGDRPTMISGDLAAPVDHVHPQWSADGSRILFTAGNTAYVVAALGGSPKAVLQSKPIGTLTARWSPDGALLAYNDSDGVHVRSANGGADRLVARGSTLHDIAWSPNGALLAYSDGAELTFGNASASTISIVPAAGGAAHHVTDSIHVNASPAWAPDGRSILYVSTAGGAFDVWQQGLGRDGRANGAPNRLTTNLGVHAVSVSADGKSLAYDVVRSRGNIASVDLAAPASAQVQPITSGAQNIEAMRVSRDGKWLVFDSDKTGNVELYKVALAGSPEPVQLTNTPASEFWGTWSPDASEIAFHSARARHRAIFIIRADGGGEHQITSLPDDSYMGDWSPDGRSIAFMNRSPTKSDLYVITRDASGASAANGTWGAPRRVGGTPGSRSPRWSPDGSSILYIDAARSLMSLPLSGGAPRVVLDSAAVGARLDWLATNASSSTVIVAAGTQAARTFWSVPLDGRPAHKVFTTAASQASSNSEFDTDGRRLFVTIRSIESDVYIVDLKR